MLGHLWLPAVRSPPLATLLGALAGAAYDGSYDVLRWLALPTDTSPHAPNVCTGCCRYVRFSPSLIAPFLALADGAAPPAKELAACVHGTTSAWDHIVEPFHLPPGVEVMMADVACGANTPSMVKQVQKWRQSDPVAEALWQEYAAAKRPLEHSVCNGVVCEARSFIYDRWEWLWDWRRRKPMTTMVATAATTARASTAARAHAARSACFAARSRNSSGVNTRSDGERKWLTELGAARAEIAFSRAEIAFSRAAASCLAPADAFTPCSLEVASTSTPLWRAVAGASLTGSSHTTVGAGGGAVEGHLAHSAATRERGAAMSQGARPRSPTGPSVALGAALGRTSASTASPPPAPGTTARSTPGTSIVAFSRAVCDGGSMGVAAAAETQRMS